MTQGLPPHAMIRPLTIKDVDQFVEVESAGFVEPAERCSREKAEYRLRVCPELSAGVFIRQYSESYDDKDKEKAPQADGEVADPGKDEDYEDVEDDDNTGRNGMLPQARSSCISERLIAHIMATKTDKETLTDESMELPDVDEYGRTKDKSDPRGHKEEGRTICIHAIVVHPDFQGKSIGSIMLRDYIQRIATQHIADRIAIIAHDHLIPFYERFNFQDMGPSDCNFAGGNWHALWHELSDQDEDEEE